MHVVVSAQERRPNETSVAERHCLLPKSEKSSSSGNRKPCTIHDHYHSSPKPSHKTIEAPIVSKVAEQCR